MSKLYDKSQLRKAWNDGVRMARMRVGFSDHTYTPSSDKFSECIDMLGELNALLSITKTGMVIHLDDGGQLRAPDINQAHRLLTILIRESK